MQCLRLMLIVSLAIFTNGCTPKEIDSFCEAYIKVVVKAGTKIVAPLDVKKRLLANEKLYREQCPQS